MAPAAPSPLDLTYQAERLRLAAATSQEAATQWAVLLHDRAAAIARTVQVVQAGQAHTVRLLDAYMALKTLQATGAGSMIGLDPALYTTSTLRGVPADVVYSRPFGALKAFQSDGSHPGEAKRAALASLDKLVRTDLQLSQAAAARDWMSAEKTIVGYRRVLSGPGPHCPLCTAAATRTYRKSDLMPIHEHCTCTVEPLWGTEPVASIGTTVRVELDPELGPRLMAADWSPVGPRITL